MTRQSAIETQGVSFSYEQKPVLRDITFSVGSGELIALIGPNGSGKTTLLRLLLGFLSPSAGKVSLENKPLPSFGAKARAKKIAYVSQQPPASFPLTVFELVSLGRYPHAARFGADSTDISAVDGALERTDTKHLKERFFSSLSGGEKQKVLIARALAQSARILLLDEPTLHLDLFYQLQILSTLRNLCLEQGVAVVTVLHDINLVGLFADKALLLSGGALRAFGPVAEVIDETSIRNLLGVEMKAIEGEQSGARYFVPRRPYADTRGGT
ncbi:MAG: ABC transporter ATP-binding protein [Candidatus Binatia bacterium]